MKQITPMLWFDTEGEEAAKFYVSLLPDSRITGAIPYGPENPDRQGQPMLVQFELLGQPYSALNGGPDFRFTEAVSLEVTTEGQDETDRLWEALCEGGEPGPCGWLKDRYGLSWQVVPTALYELMADPDRERAQRVVDAMLKVSGRALNIAELQAAADG